MKKLSLFLLLALLGFGPMAWAQWQGSGTEADPYQIRSTADWNTLANNVKISISHGAVLLERISLTYIFK